MDLKLFLDPVDTDLISSGLSNQSFQQSIFINSEVQYDLDGIDIVLLGLTEGRGAGNHQGYETSITGLRKHLYSLTKTSGKNRVLDLGNLRNGPTAEDTYLRLKEVIEFLLEQNILPILMGGSHDMAIGQYLGYEQKDSLVTLLNIDARFDLAENDDVSKSFLGRIFKHDPNYLFNYIHMGHQSYFVDEAELAMLERLCFESYRLGELKGKIQEAEPIIRDADLAVFDMSSIQRSYCPDVLGSNVFGFTGEEACQLAWYAGLNDKLSTFGLYNMLQNDENATATSEVAATMIWYFIDGFYHRKGDKNFMSNDYLIYEVSLGGNPDTIRFYKSKLSEKWWMEVPDDSEDSVFLRNKMVPCSYSDYETATQGEVPQRWVSALAKMS